MHSSESSDATTTGQTDGRLTRFQSPTGAWVLPPPPRQPTVSPGDQLNAHGHAGSHERDASVELPPLAMAAVSDRALSPPAARVSHERPLPRVPQLQAQPREDLSPSSTPSLSSDPSNDLTVSRSSDVDPAVRREGAVPCVPSIRTAGAHLGFDLARPGSPVPPDVRRAERPIVPRRMPSRASPSQRRSLRVNASPAIGQRRIQALPPLSSYGSTYHGRSPEQLSLIRRMWARRFGDWIIYTAQQRLLSDGAHDDLVPFTPPESFHPARQNDGEISEYSTNRRSDYIQPRYNANIFPRMGHLYTRNDTRHILIDWSLRHIPVHALFCTFLVHDLNYYGAGRFKLAIPFGRGASRYDAAVPSTSLTVSSNASLAIPYDEHTMFPGRWKVLLVHWRFTTAENRVVISEALQRLQLHPIVLDPGPPAPRQPSEDLADT
ncbi:hypothetical protein K474DRAFT_1708925 [Panus rudis PR-1116 ss-1]|nr:hypothetical protein K474DRAFT_1708925 [Panus rudis PR-1116 ss-1]